MPTTIRLPGLRDKRQSGPLYTVRLNITGSVSLPSLIITTETSLADSFVRTSANDGVTKSGGKA